MGIQRQSKDAPNPGTTQLGARLVHFPDRPSPPEDCEERLGTTLRLSR